MRTAADLVTSPPIEAWPDTTLRDLAVLLSSNDIGAVLVRGTGGEVAGVISERDVVRALADDADPDVERVSDHMTYEVSSVPADTAIDSLVSAMLDAGVRHLPVDDRDGKVLGVVSIREVLAAVAGT